MIFDKKLRWLTLCVMPILAACTFPGQYFGADPESKEQIEQSANGVDYRLTPIDAVTIRALARNTEEVRTVPTELRATPDIYQYKVGVGDLVRVTVWDHPELTNPAGNTTGQLQGQVVLPDGTFYFPFLNKVNAAGRTTEEIRLEMTRNLEKFIRSPQVDVYIQPNGFRSQKVYVSGEVGQPGFFPISDVPTRLSDVISLAGGLNRDADLQNITLQRNNKSFILDAYKLLYEGDLSQNVLLEQGDVLNIPDRRLRKVFLMGEVVQPGSFVMPVGTLTLAEVLSDVGGINQNTSNAQQVYVIRQPAPGINPAGFDSGLEIYHLDSSSPTSVLYADQFEMQPRDVVYVDPVRMVRINRLLGTILPTLQVLPAIRSNIRVLEGE
ncbi:polysaccharide biosynthesis/export family protein [Limnobacter sp. MED105]|uniref:polysaccharide biosynthesis/export family protein n=1 Tax=Limnobacter sp. MED105 TaxID=391597 RepID=UPI000156C5FB|nr:polysaccharide biosynthesis/export family protein [Limnobacter sp. MED105]EDM85045.1 Polysaccharide export protein [Limnobacter sp. MED105]